MSGSGSFQLTASQGGWLVTREKSYVVEMISTHSLTRRLTWRDLAVKASEWISTHSLTRRLTRFSYRIFHNWSISTHSLTRRLTGSPHKPIAYDPHFNSQPHKEADSFQIRCCCSDRYFNSQPHKEADDAPPPPAKQSMIFQLTASQGGWPDAPEVLPSMV